MTAFVGVVTNKGVLLFGAMSLATHTCDDKRGFAVTLMQRYLLVTTLIRAEGRDPFCHSKRYFLTGVQNDKKSESNFVIAKKRRSNLVAIHYEYA